MFFCVMLAIDFMVIEECKIAAGEVKAGCLVVFFDHKRQEFIKPEEANCRISEKIEAFCKFWLAKFGHFFI